MEPIVSIQNISKRYQLYDSPKQRLRDALLPFGKRTHREFWALRDISFDVPRGQALGIIGRNGSGKSTLLQIVCGVLRPTAGQVATRGRVSALLELGAGFNPEYTGRNNVYMNLALVGFSRSEIDDRFESIERFAEIGEFIDQPVKVYSTGLFVRLAFACAVSADPDLLVVDEALGVGDIFFQQKCFSKIREIIARGTTCLFVSHDTAAILNLCQEAILLRQGEMEFKGVPEEAVSRYWGSVVMPPAPLGRTGSDPRRISSQEIDGIMEPAEIQLHNILWPNMDRHGQGGLQIVAARVVDGSGRDTLEVQMLEPLTFYLLLEAREPVTDPSAGIHLFDRMGNLVFAAGTHELCKKLPSLDAGQQLVVRLDLTFNTQSGQYTFSLGASAPWGCVRDHTCQLGPIIVQQQQCDSPLFYGMVQLPMKAAFSRLSNGDGTGNDEKENRRKMNSPLDESPVLRRFLKRPQHIKIEVTNICNANCTFCAYQFMERKKDIMPMDLCARVIQDYVEMGGGALTLSSVVGDCLIDPHLLDKMVMVRSCPQIGMVNIFTNLIALDKWDDPSVIRLLELIDLWSISIGPNRETYKELFQVDQFERVISSLERLFRLRASVARKPVMRLLGRAVVEPFVVDERIGRFDPAMLRRESWLLAYSDWGGTIPAQPRNTPVIRSSPEQDKTKVCTLPLMTTVVFCDGKVGLCGCADYDAALTIGDLKDEKLRAIVAGRRRRLLLESFPNQTLNRYCRQCTFYQPANEQELAGWVEGTHPIWPEFG